MKSDLNKLEVLRARNFSTAAKIGWNIREQREARGLTQRQLADRAGISHVSLANIELGKANTSLGLIDKIAEAMHMKVDMGLRRKLGE